jgi:exonuclease VII small subunit
MDTEYFEDEYQSLIDSIESLENEELWSQRVIDEQYDD